jgi:hypothetical protein
MLDFRCVISKTMFENMELVERGLGLGCCSACALGGAVRDPGAEPCNLSAVSYLASRTQHPNSAVGTVGEIELINIAAA